MDCNISDIYLFKENWYNWFLGETRPWCIWKCHKFGRVSNGLWADHMIDSLGHGICLFFVSESETTMMYPGATKAATYII